jgi:NADH:ubiquinone reductase (H+-translocating)
VLSPAQIASPIRELLKNQRNATVFLGEVTGINQDAKFVYVSNEDHKDAPIRYDILIVATGVTHGYFGHDEFAEFAPGLKELADAVRIRNKILKAFERAEAEDNPSLRQDLLTFVLVGAGPTGIELAASVAIDCSGGVRRISQRESGHQRRYACDDFSGRPPVHHSGTRANKARRFIREGLLGCARVSRL